MAALAPEKQQQYDVFLVHSSEDNAKAMQINEALKAKDMNTWAHYKEGNEFFVGKPIFDNIIYAVERSKIVLILVTKNALHSSWVTFEMILSFEKSNREKSMCARLVFEGVTEEEKKKFLTGDLELIPSVTIDFNKDKWVEELVEKINGKLYVTYTGFYKTHLTAYCLLPMLLFNKKFNGFGKCALLTADCQLPTAYCVLLTT